MCGVCGEISFEGIPASLQAVRRMSKALASRGPDGHGVWAEGPLAFGHRRLKVIDLSDRAAQPMVDADLGLGVVYNGAVYNHLELRAELEDLGYCFFSASDTEVLLKAYHAWGEDFVKRLDGMFAFAVWELESGSVLLGRDRLGIKPLYYAELKGGLRFASSLPALLAAGDLSSDIDPVSLHYYMTLWGAVPGPRTLLKAVRKLPPGHLLRIGPDGAISSRRYWRLEITQSEEDEGLDPQQWRELTATALRRAVRRRLIADIPVGVLLSGGLDSSLIVALMAELERKPTTFSIGFEGVGDVEGDEFAYSRQVASRFDTEHHEIRIDGSQLLPAIEHVVAAMSEPLVNPDAIGFYLLAREVSESVSVVLCGQGADELFAGYSWHPIVHACSPLGRLAYAAIVFNRAHGDYCRAMHPRFVAEDATGALLAERFADGHATSDLDHALHFDTTVRLPEDPLKRVDDMAMAWGIEARVPFLAHELVELAARMPPELKLASGGKGPLKDMARELLPGDVIDRRKANFPVPPLERLRGAYLEFVHDLLTSRRAQERRLFRPEYVESLLSDAPRRGSSVKLWQAAVLELWLGCHDL